MKHIKLSPIQNYIIRVNRKEDVIVEIKKFCQKNKIFSGSFYGIGACDFANLGAYSVKTKKYLTKEFSGEHEITSILGIITDKKIHVHATISDENFNVSGGHVNKMRVSGACEIHLFSADESISRKLNKKIGLELLNI